MQLHAVKDGERDPNLFGSMEGYARKTAGFSPSTAFVVAFGFKLFAFSHIAPSFGVELAS